MSDYIVLKLKCSNVNEIMIQDMKDTIRRCKGAHYTNVLQRINGEDRQYAADWIKYLEIEP
jgi:hypothetical protein